MMEAKESPRGDLGVLCVSRDDGPTDLNARVGSCGKNVSVVRLNPKESLKVCAGEVAWTRTAVSLFAIGRSCIALTADKDVPRPSEVSVKIEGYLHGASGAVKLSRRTPVAGIASHVSCGSVSVLGIDSSVQAPIDSYCVVVEAQYQKGRSGRVVIDTRGELHLQQDLRVVRKGHWTCNCPFPQGAVSTTADASRVYVRRCKRERRAIRYGRQN